MCKKVPGFYELNGRERDGSGAARLGSRDVKLLGLFTGFRIESRMTKKDSWIPDRVRNDSDELEVKFFSLTGVKCQLFSFNSVFGQVF